MPLSRSWSSIAKPWQVISLSDIFISPLEDMYVGECTPPSNLAYFVLTAIL